MSVLATVLRFFWMAMREFLSEDENLSDRSSIPTFTLSLMMFFTIFSASFLLRVWNKYWLKINHHYALEAALWVIGFVISTFLQSFSFTLATKNKKRSHKENSWKNREDYFWYLWEQQKKEDH